MNEVSAYPANRIEQKQKITFNMFMCTHRTATTILPTHTAVILVVP